MSVAFPHVLALFTPHRRNWVTDFDLSGWAQENCASPQQSETRNISARLRNIVSHALRAYVNKECPNVRFLSWPVTSQVNLFRWAMTGTRTGRPRAVLWPLRSNAISCISPLGTIHGNVNQYFMPQFCHNLVTRARTPARGGKRCSSPPITMIETIGPLPLTSIAAAPM